MREKTHRNSLLGSHACGDQNPIGGVICKEFFQGLEMVFDVLEFARLVLIKSLNVKSLFSWGLGQLISISHTSTFHRLVWIDNDTLSDIESSSLWLVKQDNRNCQSYESDKCKILESSSPS